MNKNNSTITITGYKTEGGDIFENIKIIK